MRSRNSNLIACIGGARTGWREGARRGRVFSVRDDFGQWTRKTKDLELFRHAYNGKIHLGPKTYGFFQFLIDRNFDVWRVYPEGRKLRFRSIYFLAIRRRRFLFEMAWSGCHMSNVFRESSEEVGTKWVSIPRLLVTWTCTAAVLSAGNFLDDVVDWNFVDFDDFWARSTE